MYSIYWHHTFVVCLQDGKNPACKWTHAVHSVLFKSQLCLLPHSSIGQKSRWVNRTLCVGFHKTKIKSGCGLGRLLSGSSGEVSCFQIICRILFLWLWDLSPRFLSGCPPGFALSSQGPLSDPAPWTPSPQQPRTSLKSHLFPAVNLSACLFCYQREKTLLLKGAWDQVRATYLSVLMSAD